MTPTDLIEVQAYYLLEHREREEREQKEREQREAEEIDAAIKAALPR